MDNIGTTSSWKKDTDCCAWEGITCHPTTHHVIALDLSNSGIMGTIESNSSLFLLRHLRSINLAFNYFSSSPISPNFGKFSFLKHLNLSGCDFSGEVPLEIGQLSQLETLDLSWNSILMSNFKMIIRNMTELGRLDLSNTIFDTDVFPSISNLSSLIYLGLRNCQLREELPFDILNLPLLEHLDIGVNDALYSKFSLYNWSSPLQYLDLSFVNFSSVFPSSPGKAKYELLRVLRLPDCSLYGTVPSWVWNSPKLEVLVLVNNYFTGLLDELLHNTTSTSLQYLDLRSNNFAGNISLYSIYFKLPKLLSLFLSDNKLSVKTNADNHINETFTWPTIVDLGLSSCNLLEIPYLLKNQVYLSDLDLSNNNIHGEIPKWLLQESNDTLQYLDLSRNSLTGDLASIPSTMLYFIDVSSNLLQGGLPIPLATTTLWFATSNNNFSGPIGSSICNLTSLRLLDLSNNSLSGDIPHCLGSLSDDLIVLNLGSNNIHGTLPSNFSKCASLQYLDVNSNAMQGMVPRSLTSCINLQLVNLGSNKLRDEFLYWMHTLPEIQVLDLSYNSFHGPVTHSNAKISYPKLQILTLSSNKFSRKIPRTYIRSFKAMMNASQHRGSSPQYMGAPVTTSLRHGYTYSIELSFNGMIRNYQKVITTLSTFDLSNNAFNGEIPDCIGELKSIHSLNLSHNELTGPIPPSIRNLKSLNSLDLSVNKLVGNIPEVLASLTSLGVFNVSKNQLVGQIPHENNFNTFQADSYEENLGLCGFPLPECGLSSSGSSTSDIDNDDNVATSILHLSYWEITMLAYGCGTVLGLAWGWYMLSVGKPFWFTKLAFEVEYAIVMFFKKQAQKRARKLARSNSSDRFKIQE